MSLKEIGKYITTTISNWSISLEKKNLVISGYQSKTGSRETYHFKRKYVVSVIYVSSNDQVYFTDGKGNSYKMMMSNRARNIRCEFERSIFDIIETVEMAREDGMVVSIEDHYTP